jgi:hypothetical protein
VAGTEISRLLVYPVSKAYDSSRARSTTSSADQGIGSTRCPLPLRTQPCGDTWGSYDIDTPAGAVERLHRGQPIGACSSVAGVLCRNAPVIPPRLVRDGRLSIRLSRLALEGASDHRDVLAAETLPGNLFPLASKRGENAKAVRISLLEGKMDVLERQGQRELW